MCVCVWWERRTHCTPPCWLGARASFKPKGGRGRGRIDLSRREDGEHHFLLRLVQPQAAEEPRSAGNLPHRHRHQPGGHGLQLATHQRPGGGGRYVCLSLLLAPTPGPPFPLGPAPVCELNTSAAPYIAGGGKPVCLHVPCPSVLQVLHCLTQSLMQTPRCLGGRKGVNALV